jgi:hypothetical protein
MSHDQIQTQAAPELQAAIDAICETFRVSAVWLRSPNTLEIVFQHVPETLADDCPTGVTAEQVSTHTVLFTVEAIEEDGDGDEDENEEVDR